MAGQEREWAGEVQLMVPVEIHVPDMDWVTFEQWFRTVRCPRCQSATGLTLRAKDRKAYLICPEDGLGFSDPGVNAASVRQTYAIYQAGVPADRPLIPVHRGDPVVVSMLPRLEEDRTPQPANDVQSELRDWSWEFGITSHVTDAPFMAAMTWARRLVTWAIPHDGETFERIYGSDIASPPHEAHMIMLALGLALHDAAFDAKLGDGLEYLKLADAMECLRPGDDAAGGRRRRLRQTRPCGTHTGSDRPLGTLRLTDAARLEQCDDSDWERWCDGAQRVLNEHLRAIHDWRIATQDVLSTRPGVLWERNNCVEFADDDASWYTPNSWQDEAVDDGIPKVQPSSDLADGVGADSSG
ncbi:hypothetical protein E6W39_06515 [Kitasatospora acidiphila]|uniref:Uncharacterized protein n=1 Tax=Kitasatospora acidiphila TaxID=2567942 RepID=A0A540VZ08_9ACTN|nr:hypothetical protein [Kitasatospora acidiphila]TQF01990.1 hypothetical protein E6W39_06515 [Kitasatospora acidiphila]